MWFLFGLVTLIGTVLLAIRDRRASQWSGETARMAGESASLRTGESYLFNLMGKEQRLLMGVSCPEGFHLKLKPETGVDRLFKKLGVSEEFRIGDPEFDAQVYVVAEDRRVGRVLHRSAEVRRGLLKLFRLSRFGLRLRALECHGGRLWVDYTVAKDFEETGLVANEVVPVLLEMVRELEAEGSAPAAERDPFVWKAAVLVGLSTGLLVNGLIQGYRLSYVVMPSIVDQDTWFVGSIVWALLMVGGLVVAALVWLQRSARTHLVILDMALVGALGCFGTARVLVADVNRALDFKPPEVVETDVIMRNGHVRKSLAYVVTVEDWRRESGQLRLRVPAHVHDSLRPFALGASRDRLRLRVGRGALGIRYLEEAVPIPAAAPASTE
jgi:hypothetical protein